MTLYRVWCKFEKSYVNPLTGRRGRWRVTGVWEDVMCLYRRVDSAPSLGEVGIPASKKYKLGSIISPRRELNIVLKEWNMS